MPVALAGILLSVALCFEATRRGFARRALASKFVRWPCYAAATWIVLSIRSTEFSSDSKTSWILVALTLAFSSVAWFVPGVFAARWVRALAATVFAVTAVVVILFTTGDPSLDDYGYFVGPALEWMQGEKLGSFYMQYSLLGMLVTSGLMKLGLHVHALQIAFACIAIAWLALYWWLARELFSDRRLRAFFLIALVALRVLWMQCNIAAIPQCLPLRMDLWVPLALVARKRGLTSPWTASVCALLYALDAVFGFLYVCVYVACVAAEFGTQEGRARLRVSTIAWLAAPLALAAAFNLAVFGSLVASSATHYMDLKLGFLPIDPASMFWAVLFVLLASVVLLSRANGERRFGLFLVGIAIAHTCYFLGRSHDHNLVNGAGSWILVGFFALEVESSRSPRAAKCAATVILTAILGLGSGRIVDALGRGFGTLMHGPRFEQHALDARLDTERAAWPANVPNVILLGSSDAYINYRLGLVQHGPLSPIFAHVSMEETASWLCSELKRGQRVLFLGSDEGAAYRLIGLAEELNGTRCIAAQSSRFDARESEFSSCLELALVP